MNYTYKTIKLKTQQGGREVVSEYVPVAERIKFLAEKTDYEIENTYEFYREERMFVCQCKLTLHPEGLEPRTYTAHSQAIIGQGEVNVSSALENAQTSAVGRACAMAGIGIVDSVASADEISKVPPADIKTALKNHLDTLTTQDDVNKAATEFKKKYPELYKERAYQNLFKKRIAEIIIQDNQTKK